MAAGLVADYADTESSPEREDDGEYRWNLPSTSSSVVGQLVPRVEAAPVVATKHDVGCASVIDPNTKELKHNPRYEELFAPQIGPENVFKTSQQKAKKNTLTGFVESAHVDKFRFENERRAFDAFDVSVFDRDKPGYVKRKRARNTDSADVAGYTGPWAAYADERRVSKPDPETLKIMEEYAKKRKKAGKVAKEDSVEEKSILHIEQTEDYQGRSFMHAPHDVDVNLRDTAPPSKCFIPKKLIHTFQGHTKGVQVLRWFPHTAHMLLSASMDSKIKLWQMYKGKKCIRSYLGHKLAVRDVCFNNSGTEFLSASFDRFVKLWDTETGECKQRFTTGKVPFCVKYNPDEDKQHMFLAGMQDKKIIQWDLRSGEIVQEYDRHLGAVNTITFFDSNRRFCTTSDDKSMRIWEWEIPVDTKLIQDSTLHSMPTVTLSPNLKWLVGQAMDNRAVLFQMIDEKIRFAKKKAFKGHMSAGYACTTDFSPDMSYLVSGDAEGRVFIWDWKTHKLVAKWKAHDPVCIGVLWHPHETSKLVSCGWDSLIKLWD